MENVYAEEICSFETLRQKILLLQTLRHAMGKEKICSFVQHIVSVSANEIATA
jgi:hypothetical protein